MYHLYFFKVHQKMIWCESIQICALCMQITTKYLWKKLQKTYIHGEVHCVHSVEDSSCKSFPNWSRLINHDHNLNPRRNFGEMYKLDLRLIWKGKRSRTTKVIFKNCTKLDDSYYLISQLTLKP